MVDEERYEEACKEWQQNCVEVELEAMKDKENPDRSSVFIDKELCR